MAKQQNKKSGGARKIGNRVEHCKRYKDRKRREHNKIKRVRQSNGLAEAQAYAAANGLPKPTE